ncbi:hypothetical protein CGRA01v4_08618 [Colletotrichum graminicola]|nr:hypothetical protein CGRA01v4_08618 [Colletotrichum graminicola]
MHMTGSGMCVCCVIYFYLFFQPSSAPASDTTLTYTVPCVSIQPTQNSNTQCRVRHLYPQSATRTRTCSYRWGALTELRFPDRRRQKEKGASLAARRQGREGSKELASSSVVCGYLHYTARSSSCAGQGLDGLGYVSMRHCARGQHGIYEYAWHQWRLRTMWVTGCVCVILR